MDGESVISPEMMTKLVAVFRSRPSVANAAPPAAAPVSAPVPLEAPREAASGADLLSPREREILLLIARGDSNKLIARELDIAETTVKIHVQHILRKLGLSSRVQAAVFATSQGLA
jgi:two-component system nitrate/nitrite response regulator NarL